jgi:membrane protein
LPGTSVSRIETAARPSVLAPWTRWWRGVFGRAAREFINDDIPTVAAGATFYILLAFFPAVAAFVSLYGLFADIHAAREHLSYLRGILPGDVLRFVGDEMIRVVSAHQSKLSGAFILSLLISLWSANAGISALITGLNVAYEQKETRGFVAVHILSLVLTIGALIVSMGAFVLLVAVPAAETKLGVSGVDILEFLRWPLLFIGSVAALAVIYRYGPNRKRYKRRHVLLGALVASLLWLLMSLAFSWYLGSFGHYDRTYGSLGTMVGFLMWIWLGLIVILFGAELNAEVEKLR